MLKLLLLPVFVLACTAIYSQAPGPTVKKKATATIPVATQCYQLNLNKGKKQFNEGQYLVAKATFQKALVCSDAENGKDARVWIAKCDDGIVDQCKQSEITRGKSLYEQGDYINARLAFSRAMSCANNDNDGTELQWINKCNEACSEIQAKQTEKQKLDADNRSKYYLESVNNINFKMILIQGGTFFMGYNDGYFESPSHQVTVNNLYLSETEVTQKLWESITGNNHSDLKGYTLPVTNITWEEVQSFIRKLNELTSKNYRLPTEAEWEFAAIGGMRRGDTWLKWSGTNERDSLCFYAWYKNNSDGIIHPVGMLLPNLLGLFDMNGNVSEYCQDWSDNYTSESQINPQGPTSGEMHIIRGGYYNSYAGDCFVRVRDAGDPSSRNSGLGFRLACSN